MLIWSRLAAVTGLAALACFLPLMPAAAFDTSAASAWVYDVKTDTVLLEKNAETPIHPASMSKLMTVFMLFEALRDGRVALDERFSVSSRARAMTGSTMFLNEADRPTAEDLIRGIVVLSGNDACVVVAEGLAGTEAEFSRKMNERAKQLGLHSSHFTNSTGWPDPDHLMSAADLGNLATRLIRDFPEYYKYFSLTEFPYDGRSPANRFNRNPLLKLGIGADGLKTGHTQEAGYGLVGSAKQGDRRVVFVIAGMSSEKQRAEEAERVVNWAFREFVQKTVVKKGSKVADAAVWMGDAESVGLVVEEDLSLLLPSLVQDKLAANIRYTGPIEAPVSAGTKLAEMIVDIPGHAAVTVPLVAESDVAKSGFKKRLGIAFGILSTRLAAELGG
jgi:serine-type D-Ala-D-Ala carboxypeptidase (penicillin-binding protein 5/6)